VNRQLPNSQLCVLLKPYSEAQQFREQKKRSDTIDGRQSGSTGRVVYFFLQLFLLNKEKVDRSPFQRERTKPRQHTKKQVNRFPKGSNFL
jgi:hypothetical protein